MRLQSELTDLLWKTPVGCLFCGWGKILKKIKNLWENNKVLIVLGLILVACLVAILIVSFSYFFGGSKNEW